MSGSEPDVIFDGYRLIVDHATPGEGGRLQHVIVESEDIAELEPEISTDEAGRVWERYKGEDPDSFTEVRADLVYARRVEPYKRTTAPAVTRDLAGLPVPSDLDYDDAQDREERR